MDKVCETIRRGRLVYLFSYVNVSAHQEVVRLVAKPPIEEPRRDVFGRVQRNIQMYTCISVLVIVGASRGAEAETRMGWKQ